MRSILDDIRNAFNRKNNGLIQLIMFNCMVYLCVIFGQILAQLFELNDWFDFIFNKLTLPLNFKSFIYQPWSYFTSIVVETKVWALLFEMLLLYWFGSLIEEFLGFRRLLNIYILGGLISNICLFLAFFIIPGLKNLALSDLHFYGADACVYAVIFAATAMLPNYSFFLIIIGSVRIKYIAFFYIFLSILLIANNGESQQGLAQIFGAVFGYFFVKQLQNGVDLGKPLNFCWNLIDTYKNRRGRGIKSFKVLHRSARSDEESEVNYPSANLSSEIPDEDEVDELLDKISKSGYESLTKDEKIKLFKASQK